MKNWTIDVSIFASNYELLLLVSFECAEIKPFRKNGEEPRHRVQEAITAGEPSSTEADGDEGTTRLVKCSNEGKVRKNGNFLRIWESIWPSLPNFLAIFPTYV